MNECVTTQSDAPSEPCAYDAAHPDDTLCVIGPAYQSKHEVFKGVVFSPLSDWDLRGDTITLTSLVLKGVPSLVDRIHAAQRSNHGHAPDHVNFTEGGGFGFGILFRNKKKEVVRALYFNMCNIAGRPTLHSRTGESVCYETLALSFINTSPWTEGLPPA